MDRWPAGGGVGGLLTVTLAHSAQDEESITVTRPWRPVMPPTFHTPFSAA